MPAVRTPRQKTKIAASQSETLDDFTSTGVVDKPAPKTRSTKQVPISKLVSGTLQKRVSSIFAKWTSATMLQSFGIESAVTPDEAYNVYYPLWSMLARRFPELGLKFNVSGPDADDIELIIVSVLNYTTRIIDNALTSRINKRLGIRPQQTQPQQYIAPQPQAQPTPRSETRNQPRPQTSTSGMRPPSQEEYEESLSDLFDNTSGEEIEIDDGIVPMKPTGTNLADLVANGYISGDNGEYVTQ